MKTASLIAVLIGFVVAGFAVTHAYLLDGIDGWIFSLLDDEDDTLYSGGYSDAAFRRVRPGITEPDLLTLLDAPLAEVWIYGSAPPDANSVIVAFSDSIVTHVDEHAGKVVTKIYTGMKKSEVLRLAGEPLEKSFVYSQSQHDQSYRVRAVVLSRGVVRRRESYFYID